MRRRLARTFGVAVIASVLLALTPSSAESRTPQTSLLGSRSSPLQRVEGGTVMPRLPAVLVVLAVLGTAATTAWATPPGKNGQLVFRRYLDVGRTTGPLFTANQDGSKVRQITHPASGVI